MTGRPGEWFRNQIACYGAVIAIILEQLDAAPRSTLTENPNPLVRIRDAGQDNAGWHPDELIERGDGRACVLVWSHRLDAEYEPNPVMSAN
jgi:hypothetical protein